MSAVDLVRGDAEAFGHKGSGVLVAPRGAFPEGPVRFARLDGAPMVRSGIGSGVLPRLVVQSAATLSEGALTLHELVPKLRPREIHLLWQGGRTHSPLAARAIEIAVEIAATYGGDARTP